MLAMRIKCSPSVRCGVAWFTVYQVYRRLLYFGCYAPVKKYNEFAAAVAMIFSSGCQAMWRILPALKSAAGRLKTSPLAPPPPP